MDNIRDKMEEHKFDGKLNIEDFEQDLNKEIERLRFNSDEEIRPIFTKPPEKVNESKFIEDGLIKDEEVKTIVKHAYCPKCGKELISNTPLMLNVYTQESIAIHKCSCGYEVNLEYAYPRVAFLNSKNEEIKAYSK